MIAKNNPTPKNAYLICFSASFRITNKVRQIINIANLDARDFTFALRKRLYAWEVKCPSYLQISYNNFLN